MKREFTKLMAALALLLFIAPLGMWGQQSTVLFHETFGNNSGSARAWNDSYSVKSGVAAVYSGITGYTVDNLKQSKNTMGYVQSGLTQTTKNQDAYIIIGPLNLASYSDLNVTYWWKAASINGTYSTHLYYATNPTGTFTEVNGTGSGATTYVQRSYSLPNACQISSLYLKVVFNTSNTQALIDEFEITSTSSSPTYNVSINSMMHGTVVASPSSTAAGVTVTLTPQPEQNYALGSIDVTGETSHATPTGGVNTLNDGATYTFTMPAENVNVGATFKPTTAVTIDDTNLTNTNLNTSTVAGSLSASVKENVNNTTISNASIAWTSSDAGVATIAGNGSVTLVGVGTTTITATYAGDTNYAGSTETYQLTVVNLGPHADYIFNTDAGLAALGITKPSLSQGTDLVPGTDYNSGIVTMNITHGTTHTRVWGGTNATDLRVYGGGGSLTFSVPSGYLITGIELTGSAINTFEEVNNSGVWSGTASRTVTLTANNTGKINTITVIYQNNTSGVDDPELTASCEFQNSMEVSISCVTENATVYYTLDNTDPKTSNTREEYTEPFTINATKTVKAVAYLDSNYSNVVTATYTRVYAITLIQPVGGTITATPNPAAQGANVTLISTPNVGYSFGSWISSDVTVTNNQFVMPASNVTVTASFTASTTAYIISFFVNNKIEMTATVYDGGSIDLTKFEAFGDNYTFEGWSETDGGTVVENPSSYTPNGDITLYPGVAAQPSSDVYTLVTNVDQLVAGNKIVIAAHGETETAMGPQDTNNRPEVEITKNSDNTITWGADITVSELTLGTVTSGGNTYWTFYDPDYTDGTNTGGYLYAVANSNRNYLKTQHTNNADGYWTISITTNNANITANGTNTSSRKLQRNASAHVFSTYTGTQQPVYIYTKSVSSKATRDNVSAKSKVTGIAADVLVTVKANGIVYIEGSNVNAGNSSNLVVEEGGQIVTDNSVAGTMLKSVVGYGNNTDASNYYLISHPLTSSTDPVNVRNMLNNNGYDLYYFQQNAVDDSELLEWRNYKDNNFDLFVGSGYLYANKDNSTLQFAGNLRENDDDSFNRTIHYYEGFRFSGWNLVGNPFPSNASVNMPFYKMKSSRDGINGTAVVSGSVIAPMEGVFVIAANSNAQQQVTFTATTDPVGSPAKNNVNIDVNRDNEFLDRAIVNFNGCTLSKLNLSENATKVYFQQGQEEFAIVSVENEGELPVNFKASRNGRYTMSVDIEDLDMNYLHLIDNKTGMDIDLLQTPSYTFQANTGDNAYRFRLVFDANSVQENNTTANFAYFNGSEWVVNNMGEATLQVIDMMGRVLSSETLNGNTTFTLNQVPGVYMFRLVNGNDVKVQKVVVR